MGSMVSDMTPMRPQRLRIAVALLAVAVVANGQQQANCAFYTCPAGYTAKSPASNIGCVCCGGTPSCGTMCSGPSANEQCTANVQQNTDVCCTPNSCTKGPQNAQPNTADYSACNVKGTGEVCTPTCDTGYYLDPAAGFTLTCLAPNMQYDASGGTCLPVQCPAMAGGGATNYNQVPGPGCDCAIGYTMMGAQTIDAMNNQYNFVCATQQCVVPKTGTTDAFAEYSQCNNMVQTGGMCTPRCGCTVDPATMALSNCDTYYASSGAFTVLCEAPNGEYDASAHTCTPYACMTEMATGNMYTLDWNDCKASKVSGDICTPTCQVGCTLISDITLQCNMAGEFDVEDSCTQVPCPPNSMRNMFNCECMQGYSGNLVWDANAGAWMGSCTANPCFGGATTPVALVDYSDCLSKNTGETCTVACNQGYYLTGGSTTENLVCTLDAGTMTYKFTAAAMPTCTARTCPPNSAQALMGDPGSCCTAPGACCAANYILDRADEEWDATTSTWVHQCLASCNAAPYACGNFYGLKANPATVACTSNSLASCTTDLCCDPNTCLAVSGGGDPNGVYTDCITMPSKVTGNSCPVSCNAGYTPSITAITTLECTAAPNGEFVSALTCQPNGCSAGPTTATRDPFVKNYDDCNILTTGQMCTPECMAGYRLTGPASFTLECTQNQYAFDTTISCVANDCDAASSPDPNIAPTGYDNCNLQKTGGSCTPLCKTGYALMPAGSVTLECSVTGAYDTMTTCVQQPCPEFAAYNAMGDCECTQGYSSTTGLIWNGASWSGTCTPNPCPADTIAFVLSPMTLRGNTGDSVTVTCQPGYIASFGTATCKPTGTWDKPTCDPQPCPVHDPIPNAASPAGTFTGNANDVQMVTCADGYKCSVSPCELKCQPETLAWTDLTCDAVPCPENASPIGTCSCNAGYITESTATPVGPTWDTATEAWTHTCYASCGLYGCGTYETRNTPGLVKCAGSSIDTCAARECCLGAIFDPVAGSTLLTTEQGGSASFSVVLVGKPDVDVTVEPDTGMTDEGSIMPAKVVFTPMNWDQPQQMTVMGLDDFEVDGDQSYNINLIFTKLTSAKMDGTYAPEPMKVTNADNDQEGILVTPLPVGATDLMTYEANVGTPATFSVVLQTQPAAGTNVEITIQSSDTTQGLLSYAGGAPAGSITVQFTDMTWNAAATVSVVAVDNDINEDDRSFTILTQPAQSADTNYRNLNPADISAVNIDDDKRGVTVTTTTLETSEAGGQVIFNVKLDSEPTAPVTTMISLSDTTEATLSTTMLVFQPSDWNLAKPVTVTGKDDAIADGTVDYVVFLSQFTSSDLKYAAINPADVILTNLDNDLASVTVSPTTGLLVGEDGTNATYAVVLTSEPLNDVTVEAISRDETEGKTAPVMLVFTPTNYMTAQTFTVMGVDDMMDDGLVNFAVTHVVISGDETYNGLSASDVNVANSDNDTAAILVDAPADMMTTEAGGQDTFTIVLATQPSDSVTIELYSTNEEEGVVLQPTVIFTTTSWDVVRTISVAGIDESIDDGNKLYYIKSLAAVSTMDMNYAGVMITDIPVRNEDDDTAGIVVDPTSGLVTTERNQGSAAFEIVLSSQPLEPVTIGLTSSDPSEGQIDPVTLTEVVFTNISWNIPYRVTVKGQDETLKDGNTAYTIDLAVSSSADPNYNGRGPTAVSIINEDDDKPGIEVIPNELIITQESCGNSCANDKFDVVLKSIPAVGSVVVLTVRTDDDTEGGIIQGATLTFNHLNWNNRQTVQVFGVRDKIDDGNQTYNVIIESGAGTTDPNYIGFPTGGLFLPAVNIDADEAGIIIKPETGLTTSEEGASATATVMLKTKPENMVIVKISAHSREGVVSTGTKPAAESITLTFDSMTWDTPQTLTVTGVDDLVDDDDFRYNLTVGPITSLDQPYRAISHPGIEVLNLDNDTAGIEVVLPENVVGADPVASDMGELITREAETVNTFMVKLLTEPSSTVTISVKSSDITEGTVSPSELIFTPADWLSGREVRVTGAADDYDDGDVKFMIQMGPVVTMDEVYALATANDVPVINLDDDTANLFVSGMVGGAAAATTGEDGSFVTYTIALTSRPTDNVRITFVSTDTSEGVLSTDVLMFNNADWGFPKTITVTGIDDSLADGNSVYTIQATLTSADPDYNGLQVTPFPLTNNDDDVAGFTVTPMSGLTTTEMGNKTHFTVVLDTEPVGSVTFNVLSLNTKEITASPTTLQFEKGSWNVPQTVMLMGMPDNMVEATSPVVLVNVTVTSAPLDAAYLATMTKQVSVTNIDVDKPGLQVLGAPLTTSETPAGMTSSATFTVGLNSIPTDPVTIGVVSTDTTEGVTDVTEVVLSKDKMTAEVVVTAVDDNLDDDDVTYSIILNMTRSLDPNYNMLTSPNVTVTNIDDDTAMINVQYPPDDPGYYTTSEMGAGETFTVVLATKPTGPVELQVMSSDETEGQLDNNGLSTLSLVFGQADWDVPQTIKFVGQDDNIDDGDVMYMAQMKVLTTDPVYSKMQVMDVRFKNVDNDEAKVNVSRTTVTTSETGTTETFTVLLLSEPTDIVQISMASSLPKEATVMPVAVEFDAANWNVAQTVMVTGVDDNMADGDQTYTIFLKKAVSNDLVYSGIDPVDVSGENLDDERAAVIVQPTVGGCYVPTGTNAGKMCVFPFEWDGREYLQCAKDMLGGMTNWCSTAVDVDGRHVPGSEGMCNEGCTGGLTTSEGPLPNDDFVGTMAAFTMRLSSKPEFPVTLNIRSDDLSEGTVDPAQLVILPAEWNVPQSVTVMAVDDPMTDGDQVYSIVTSRAVSMDPVYNTNVDPPDVVVMNKDNEEPGITVGDGTTLMVDETGTTATFTVRLGSQPVAGISMSVTVSDTTEATLSHDALLFTSYNWDTVQTVTVTGRADNELDGDQTFTVMVHNLLTSDMKYKDMEPMDVLVVNKDIYDECVQNGFICHNAGQMCNDPDPDPARLGNWLCMCKDSDESTARAGPAICQYTGECVDNREMCTAKSQICVDTPGVNNWMCECPAPSVGEPQIMMAATCTLDECTINGALCTANGQLCADANPSLHSRGDWECQCPPPRVGMARGAVAGCEWRGECVSKYYICEQAGQLCNDPNVEVAGDWECVCQLPSVGRATREPADCVVDECLANAAVCTVEDQACRDPNLSPESLGDWFCECIGSDASGRGSQQPAMCTVDECEIMANRDACLNFGQQCEDPDPSPASRNDWRCNCVAPATGSERAAPATCAWLGECALLSVRSVCINPQAGITGQTCDDPNPSPSSLNDWQCVCVEPYRRTSKVGKPATCVLDECETNRVTCMARGQSCLDPNTDPRMKNDWMCVCGAPAVGTNMLAPAVCAYQGECVEKGHMCESYGQTCNDPDVNTAGDWECVCVAPQDGRMKRGPAECMYDECMEYALVCLAYGQVCVDPAPTPDRTGDWTCNCVEPAQGAARTRPATCSFQGECIINSGVCTTRGQTCNDPNVNRPNDWECRCVGASVGVAVGTFSTQCELDECLLNAITCTSVNQVCVDYNKNTTSLDDWACRCSGGVEMGWQLLGPAECILDECLSYGQVCTDVGQRCIDPNTDPAYINDWMCLCQGSGTGQAVGKVAECMFSAECALKQAAECQDLGMTCVDPIDTTEGDAYCACVYPRQQKEAVAPGEVVTCELDECVMHADTCLTIGQRCTDPDRGVGALNDWVCQCIGGVGSAVARPALCQYNGECEQRAPICNRVGQACFDPDPNVVNDWVCRCATDESQFGKKTGGIVDRCEEDECIANDICGDQDCVDPNTSPASRGDWMCVCTGSNRVGEAVAQRAVCVLDECIINSLVCLSKGQVCNDPVQAPNSMNDWVCNCVPPATGSRLGNVATCTYVGECVLNAATCEKAGQTCNDPNPVSANGDWECVCVGDFTGRAVGRPAECMLDECDANAQDCYSAGQICVDPDQSAGGLGNWECRCPAPATGRKVGAPAECNHVGECIANAITCTSVGQSCRDPNLNKVGDWECVCMGGQEGRRTGGPATCIQDECVANGDVCAAVGQICRDPVISPLSLGDWQCDCVGGSASGSQRSGVATCTWAGECAANYQVCTGAGQTCYDPSLSNTGDWRCECVFPEVGSRVGKPAPCELDECLRDGLVCARMGQACEDANTNPLSVDDWYCVCQGSGTGRALAEVAECQYEGECVESAYICTQAGQYCRDRDAAVDGDWECRCVEPFTGGAIASASTCRYDECLIHGVVCNNGGQTCNDRNTDYASRDDWECLCVESQPVRSEPALAKLAECRYFGECESSAIHGICTAVGQTCVDRNLQKLNDWECSCIPPKVGAATAQPATCSLDECKQYAEICTSVGQRCVDPNQFSDSKHDWTCECTGSDETGSAIGEAADCILDECSLQRNRDVCASRGQLCEDPNMDPVSLNDWMCKCGGSGKGEAVMAPAECVYSGECESAYLTCTTAGQTCFDEDSLANTWRCECVPPYKGSARTSVATCSYDECDDKRFICENAKQICRDVNTNPQSRNDWVCECQEPLTGSATTTAAECTFRGECVANAITCTSVGQTCTDPDLTKIGDWACVCLLPQIGPNKSRGPADCKLNECLEHGHVCTSVGQACVDPDLDPESINDWTCNCVAPAEGKARGIAAKCTFPNGGECELYASLCAAAGQACNDPDLTQEGNWECVCVPPTVGRGVASTTSCDLDECVESSYICAAAGQLCNDPDKSPDSVGDWTCDCTGSGVGSAVRSVATCAWAGECATEHRRCIVAGQTCEDPNTDPSSLGDWMCVCVNPQVGAATGSIAKCTLDECSSSVGTICAYAGQLCFDPDTSVSSMGDWLCRCKAPATGEATAAVAKCLLDECGYGGADASSCVQCAANRAKCEQAGQACQDPDANRNGDWECVCPPPQIGRATNVPAQCKYDECLRNEQTCTSKGQRCVDPVTSISSTGDWECRCEGSGTGSMVGAPASCTYRQNDECLYQASVCTSQGQACMDPRLDVIGDWMCMCIAPQEGEATAEAAQCVLDECNEYGSVCTEAGQLCLDPNTAPASTGDWACRCQGNAIGLAKTRVANCVLDECIQNYQVCYAMGQVCLDPNTSPGASGDWTCNCAGSSTGSGRAIVATCAFTGECAANAYVCTSVGQTCIDPSSDIGDWVCACVAPSMGAAAPKGPAECTLDECTVQGPVCSNRGQQCRDPNTAPQSRNDWTCECMGSGTGSAIAAPATCVYTGECATGSLVCASAGQACTEASSSGDSEWSCVCIAPSVGRAVGGVAQCTLDECLSKGLVCSLSGQSCEDPNTDASSQDDWRCSCVGSNAVGTAKTMVAMCTVDECVEKGTTCTDEGQSCHDPDISPTSLGDWVCSCEGSGLGEATASAASCNFDGECSMNSGICTNQGQTCIDPDKTVEGDWMCACVPPQTGRQVGGPASCVADECVLNGDVCSAVGQMCRDANTRADSTGDWECYCPGTLDARALGPATCSWTGECVENWRTCTSAGQACVDPNPDWPGDWQCQCVAPQTGSPSPARPAQCYLDECRGNSPAFLTCTAVGQSCSDPNSSPMSLKDWRCTCEGSGTGTSVAKAADCVYSGECSMYADVCTAGGQACHDPNPTVSGDWECVCVLPAVGKAVMARANCELNECLIGQANMCGSDQICTDPDPTPSSLDDWICECKIGVGMAKISPAVCIVDECKQHGMVCSNAGQICNDPTKSADVKGDWTCNCGGSGTGSKVGGPVSACQWSGECKSNANNQLCTSVKQVCFDPDELVAGDWECRCVPPLKGAAAQGAIAVCEFDECEAGSAGQRVCSGAGQICNDPKKTMEDLLDWTCSCVAPAVGIGVTRVAQCSWVGECRVHFQTCTQAGQTCVDPNVEIEGDWECACVTPTQGANSVGEPAKCFLDECTANTICKDAGQSCMDPDDSMIGNFICSCEGDGAGSAEAQVASCLYASLGCNLNAHVCTSAGQSCSSPQQDDNYVCSCLPPLGGERANGVAVCAEGGVITPRPGEQPSVELITKIAVTVRQDSPVSVANMRRILAGAVDGDVEIKTLAAEPATQGHWRVVATMGTRDSPLGQARLAEAHRQLVEEQLSAGGLNITVSHAADCAVPGAEVRCEDDAQVCTDLDGLANGADWACTCPLGLNGKGYQKTAVCVPDCTDDCKESTTMLTIGLKQTPEQMEARESAFIEQVAEALGVSKDDVTNVQFAPAAEGEGTAASFDVKQKQSHLDSNDKLKEELLSNGEEHLEKFLGLAGFEVNQPLAAPANDDDDDGGCLGLGTQWECILAIVGIALGGLLLLVALLCLATRKKKPQQYQDMKDVTTSNTQFQQNGFDPVAEKEPAAVPAPGYYATPKDEEMSPILNNTPPENTAVAFPAEPEPATVDRAPSNLETPYQVGSPQDGQYGKLDDGEYYGPAGVTEQALYNRDWGTGRGRGSGASPGSHYSPYNFRSQTQQNGSHVGSVYSGNGRGTWGQGETGTSGWV